MIADDKIIIVGSRNGIGVIIVTKELARGFLHQRRLRPRVSAGSDRLHVVLDEVDDVVVELLHVRELGHEHVVAPPQPLVVLG